MNIDSLLSLIRAYLTSPHVLRFVELAKVTTEDVIFNNPIAFVVLSLGLLFGLLRRSKAVFTLVFAVAVIAALVHYTLPSAGDLDFTNIPLFAGGWVLATFVLIYLIMR